MVMVNIRLHIYGNSVHPLTDPLQGCILEPQMKLGEVLRKWRKMSELDLRSAAKLMSIDAATLLRIERGHPPNGQTFMKVLIWLFDNERRERAQAASASSSGIRSSPRGNRGTRPQSERSSAGRPR